MRPEQIIRSGRFWVKFQAAPPNTSATNTKPIQTCPAGSLRSAYLSMEVSYAYLERFPLFSSTDELHTDSQYLYEQSKEINPWRKPIVGKASGIYRPEVGAPARFAKLPV
jgi:hypothetical protein